MAFLAENKNKTGVVTLPSGLQYKVLNEGNGTEHPTIDSPCQVNYEGELIDGTVFDSSYARGEPSTFAPNQVIEGWTEAMQMMVVGDKWELYIPSELAYGDRGYPPVIPGGDVLIFQMELLDILGDTIPVTIPPSSNGTDAPVAAPTNAPTASGARRGVVLSAVLSGAIFLLFLLVLFLLGLGI